MSGGRRPRAASLGGVFVALLLAASASGAIERLAAGSRLLATGGGTQVEGQAGGGIVPWAVMAGYGSSGEVGASAFYTHVELDDYALDALGVAVSVDNRIEFSLARQQLDLGTLGDALGLPDKSLRQDILGLKLRVAGDLIYGGLPQIAAGLQFKRHLDFGIPAAVGAVRRRDADFFLAASKLWLAGPFDRNVFANATLRYTRANQGGLLGFGGDRDDSRDVMFEGAVGVFLNRHVAVGFEYRQQPDNLRFSDQDAWMDAFVGVFPSKHVSLVAAWASLGTVATLDGQQGWYLSLEVAF